MFNLVVQKTMWVVNQIWTSREINTRDDLSQVKLSRSWGAWCIKSMHIISSMVWGNRKKGMQICQHLCHHHIYQSIFKASRPIIKWLSVSIQPKCCYLQVSKWQANCCNTCNFGNDFLITISRKKGKTDQVTNYGKEKLSKSNWYINFIIDVECR